MRRRLLLLGAAATAAARPAMAALGQGDAPSSRLLRFVPQAEPVILDPIVTTAYATRHHAFAVWDTLYGFNHDYEPEPQMVAAHEVSEDRRQVRMRLREGLVFHNGEPVRAADCIASIRRWAARDPLGQVLMARTEELVAIDDRTLQFRLQKPFPQLFAALAKPTPPVCFIMPEHLAATPPTEAVAEIIGSGPFRFLAAEREPGRLLAYERFSGYVPRPEGVATWTAGPKRVHVERIEWHIKADAGVAQAALQDGEVDWWENPPQANQAALRGSRNLVMEILDPTGFVGMARFNALHPPFDRPAVRRALLGVVSQAAYMTAVIGEDRSLWREGVGIFTPGTALANDAGMEALTGPRDPDKVRQALREAGYGGETVALLAATDFPTLHALALTGAEMLRSVGVAVELIESDWIGVVRRRMSREPPEKGGWSMFFTFWAGLDLLNPGVQQALRGTGERAWFGWPTMPRIEELRGQWFDAADGDAELALAREIQAEALQQAPYLPLGQYFQATAYRRGLSGVLKGMPLFWNLQRA